MVDLHENKVIADINQLKECEVLDKEGRSVKISSLMKDQTSVFVFLRHFGCAACKKHTLEVWNNKDLIESKGGKIFFIGNGTLQSMKVFIENNQLEEASFYTDPSLKAFKAAGFRKGFWISPGEMHSRGEFLWLAINYKIKRGDAEGNIWQLGGVIVVNKGNIAYQFTSQMMGHFPPAEDIRLHKPTK